MLLLVFPTTLWLCVWRWGDGRKIHGGEVLLPLNTWKLWASERLSSMMKVTQLVHDNAGTQRPVSYLQAPCTSHVLELPKMPHPQVLRIAWFPHPPKSLPGHIMLRTLSASVGNSIRGLGCSTGGTLPPWNNCQCLETLWIVTTGEREADSTGI